MSVDVADCKHEQLEFRVMGEQMNSLNLLRGSEWLTTLYVHLNILQKLVNSTMTMLSTTKVVYLR